MLKLHLNPIRIQWLKTESIHLSHPPIALNIFPFFFPLIVQIYLIEKVEEVASCESSKKTEWKEENQEEEKRNSKWK
jgi:hypothetical protein